MCGILGGINTEFGEDSLSVLHHRGPDQAALHTQHASGLGQVTMGQTRLNVVDRHDVDLPVRIGDAAIVFNGTGEAWLSQISRPRF